MGFHRHIPGVAKNKPVRRHSHRAQDHLCVADRDLGKYFSQNHPCGPEDTAGRIQIEERFSGRLQYPRQLLYAALNRAGVMKCPVAEYEVKSAILEWQVVEISFQKLHRYSILRT